MHRDFMSGFLHWSYLIRSKSPDRKPGSSLYLGIFQQWGLEEGSLCWQPPDRHLALRLTSYALGCFSGCCLFRQQCGGWTYQWEERSLEFPVTLVSKASWDKTSAMAAIHASSLSTGSEAWFDVYIQEWFISWGWTQTSQSPERQRHEPECKYVDL